MKIALISARRDPFISPQDIDGGCVVLRNYIKELYNFGHEIHVFTRLEQERQGAPQDLILKAKAQKITGPGKTRVKNRLFNYRIPYNACPDTQESDLKQIAEANSFAQNLEFYFEDELFDIYHYFHLFSISGWLGNSGHIPFLKKTLFSPMLPTYGRTFEYPVKTRLKLEKQVCQQVKKIICPSSRETEIIRQGYRVPKSKLVNMPLGISHKIFYTKTDFAQFNQDKKFLIISPNAIRAQKKQIEVVKIAHHLKQARIPLVTLLVGRIQEESYFSQLIETIGKLGLTYRRCSSPPARKDITRLNSDIVFLNGLDQSQLANIIREADIAVFPSQDETFGLILLECMACGTPPICFNLPAYKDYLIPHENALVVNSSEGWKALALVAEKLLGNKKQLTLLSKTAANIASQFSWRNLVSQQLYIYSRILDRKEELYPHHFTIASWANLHK